MTRVAVIGANGRMGSTSVQAIDASDDLEAVARRSGRSALLTEIGYNSARGSAHRPRQSLPGPPRLPCFDTFSAY